jgi:arabinosyltransferase C
MMPPLSPAERRWAWGWALVVAAFASLPYLGLLAVTPPDTVFWGFVNNPDDHCVYLAWMRQAEQGQLFFRNLFTGDPQRGLHLNLFFWLLGVVGRLTQLPLALIYHLSRFGFGALLLVLVYYLTAFLTPDRAARRAAFGFVALSSGLAWLRWPPADPAVDPGRYPVDAWQPEAITFLSLYSNALFCASMAAMVGLYLCLLLAQRTGKTGYAAGAGLLGLLLGNIHSYDVISIAAVWAVYLCVTGLHTRRVPVLELRHALLAAAIGLPSVLYQYYLLQTDPVFQARAAVPTPSPPLIQYLLGYGLLIPLGMIGARSLLRSPETPRPAAYLPIIWAVVGLAVAYLPTAFQRKLVEGLHLPVALLAGFGAVWLARRFTIRPWQAWVVTALILALTVPSNLRFVAQSWQIAIEKNVGSTWLHAVFWPKADLEAMSRLDEWVPPAGIIQALPWTSCLIPAMSGRRVWAGHWGETPGFESKFRQLRTFFDPGTPSDWRRQFLAQAGITHIFVGANERALARDSLTREPFLQPVHRLGEVMLYKVALGSR